MVLQLLGNVCRSLFVVCCMYLICVVDVYLLFLCCCLLIVGCLSLLSVVDCLLFDVCCLLFCVPCCLLVVRYFSVVCYCLVV